VPEEPRHRLRIGCPLDGEEGAVAPKQTPRDQQMHVGMPIQEIPGTLQARHGAGHGGAGARGGLEKVLDRLIGQAGQAGEALPPTEEGPQAPLEREDHVPMGDRCQDLLGDELAEGRLSLGVTEGAKTVSAPTSPIAG
jgi:hypothetical protein